MKILQFYYWTIATWARASLFRRYTYTNVYGNSSVKIWKTRAPQKICKYRPTNIFTVRLVRRSVRQQRYVCLAGNRNVGPYRTRVSNWALHVHEREKSLRYQDWPINIGALRTTVVRT